MLVGDMARIVRDPKMIKTLEGLCGEEKTAGSLTLSRGDKRFKIDVVSFLAGVPSDVTAYLSHGLIFRFAPVVILHDRETQDEIGKQIAYAVGRKKKGDGVEKIRELYKWIYQVQLGRNKDFEPIQGYIIDDVQRSNIYKKWKELIDEVNPPQQFNWFRELLSAFRYMASSAMLNMANRKKEVLDGKNCIIPEEPDLKVGLYLMLNEIKLKARLLKCDAIASTLRDVKYLEKYQEEYPINRLSFELIKILMENKSK
jgi:hypothetical protein